MSFETEGLSQLVLDDTFDPSSHESQVSIHRSNALSCVFARFSSLSLQLFMKGFCKDFFAEDFAAETT